MSFLPLSLPLVGANAGEIKEPREDALLLFLMSFLPLSLALVGADEGEIKEPREDALLQMLDASCVQIRKSEREVDWITRLRTCDAAYNTSPGACEILVTE